MVEFAAAKTWAIEIKRSANAVPGRGFYEACSDIRPERKFVVHAGAEDFAVNDIQYISLFDLMKLIASPT